ncbi:Glycine oxidase [Listeria grayi]|uniref:FAD-binding oxidoreductase n=1 Tax=Listeria grayi FSL F6-1183 TaxID=1265827 RepID=A0A829R4G5_LISGR|nr:FAD-binding oxidoreductase [Listeria grayi]EUJ27121.1 FAD-binding oxidoreductase [Listeria grayi FSL F6-1183]VEI32852.1 Glycine oxidase [Listeria grayi]
MHEYIVVGAGIVGASTAYHLAKTGAKVKIIDKEELGQATKAAAGIICPWLSKRRNKIWYELAKQSAAYYPVLTTEIEQLTNRKSSYKQTGALLLRDSTTKLMALEELAHERRKEAPEIGAITTWDAEALQARYPFLSADYGAVFVSGGARIKGKQYTESLLQAAFAHGAVYHKGTASFDKALNLLVDGTNVRADKIFLTAGAWLPALFEQTAYQIDVVPQKGQLLRLQVPELLTEDWPVILPPSSKSIVPFGAGELLIGATHEKDKGFDRIPTEVAAEEILADLEMFMPQLRDWERKEITVGTRPYTNDFTPFMGRLPGQAHVYVANGLGASGLTTGPYVGRLLADMALENELPLALSLYDPQKYIKNN